LAYYLPLPLPASGEGRYRAILPCWSAFLQGHSYSLKHNIQRIGNLLVGKTQHLHPQTLQTLLANLIFFSRVQMNRAVYLNNQARLSAVEIYDKPINCVLPSEFESQHLPSSQTSPKPILDRRGFAAHLSG
jgi:hypothetical protein